MKTDCATVLIAVALMLTVRATPGVAQASRSSSNDTSSVESLAKRQQNWVSGLRQLSLDAAVSPNAGGIGETAGNYSLQIVWPFKLARDWALVSYTILPAIQQPEPGAGSTFGLGDALINLFMVPRKRGRFDWGAGPAILLPTRTDPALGTDRLALGAALVLYYEAHAASGGVLLQNGWSVGGSGFSEFGAQYAFNYNLRSGWYLFSNSTITADWTQDADDRWTVPVGGGAGRVFHIGKQSVNLSFQAVWIPEAPRGEATWSLSPSFSLLVQ